MPRRWSSGGGRRWHIGGHAVFEEWKQAKRDVVARYESKYLVPRAMVPELRAFIAPFCHRDPYAQQGALPEYVITTLQLDNASYSLHYAKEWEHNHRFKLRVRTYGDIGSAPVFAEIKAKLESTIQKWRVALPFAQWDPRWLKELEVPRFFRSMYQEIDFLQFKRLVRELDARPVLLVRYVRESHVGKVDRYARVTFDRKLQYQMTNSWTDFGRSGRWRGMDSAEAQGAGEGYSGVVMEIKTLSHAPLWVMDMVERFQLRKSGFCKYSTALWREGAFRRHPAMGAATEEALALA
jgi:hypothetical protein